MRSMKARLPSSFDSEGKVQTCSEKNLTQRPRTNCPGIIIRIPGYSLLHALFTEKPSEPEIERENKELGKRDLGKKSLTKSIETTGPFSRGSQER